MGLFRFGNAVEEFSGENFVSLEIVTGEQFSSDRFI